MIRKNKGIRRAVIGVRVKPETKKMLAFLAVDGNTDMSTYISKLLEQHIEENPKSNNYKKYL